MMAWKLLSALLFLKALFAIWFIGQEVIGLSPDEAQYWTWSQALDWGYYSKPPGIAWQIWLGVQLFGDTELGVRFLAVVINTALPLAVYAVARACRLNEWTAFWSALCMAISPLGIMGAVLATTDGGLALFWTLSSLVFIQGLSTGTVPNYPLFGLLVAIGALFKWPIYYLWIFVLLTAAAFPYLRSRKLIVGMAVSLLGLLPSFLWNMQHHWATFRHVLATIQGGHSQTVAPGNFWEFIGAQALLVSPVFFVLLLTAFWTLFRKPRPGPGVFFCGATALATLVVFSGLALKQKMQGNWCAFIYPTAFVFLGWYACERVSWGRRWLAGGAVVALLLCILGISLPLFQITPYKMNPFRHNLGWKALRQELVVSGYDPSIHFLSGDKYQTVSILSFYSPGQKRAYFLNLLGVRKNQFSYWPSMAEEGRGRDGFFIVVESAPHLENLDQYRTQLELYFETVELLGVKPLIMQGEQVVKAAFFFRCLNYNGRMPEESEKY